MKINEQISTKQIVFHQLPINKAFIGVTRGVFIKISEKESLWFSEGINGPTIHNMNNANIHINSLVTPVEITGLEYKKI